MGKYRFDARVNWRTKGQLEGQENIPLGAIVAGDSTAGFGSETAKNLGQLLQLFQMANGAKAITVFVNHVYAYRFFPQGRSIDFIGIGMYEAARLVATADCKDLIVSKSLPGAPFQTVTLDFHDNDLGFNAQPT